MKNIQEFITALYEYGIEKVVQGSYHNEIIYTLSDGRIMLHKNEAFLIANILDDKKVLAWFPEWSGNDPVPVIRWMEVFKNEDNSNVIN